MRALICPDKFRGTLSARAAADALASGWLRVRPADHVDVLPMADGGEGTLGSLVDAMGGSTTTVRVRGPLGDPIDAAFGLADGPGGRTGIVEMARASGLSLLAAGRRDPARTTTAGTGDLMRAALDAGAGRLIVSVGGSATNDGGTGMASALGVRFQDVHGEDLGAGGGELLELARIDMGGLDPRIRGTAIVCACDVDSPLCGPSGASRTFAEQKGATAEDALVLDRALGHLAAVVHRDLGVDVADEPGSGAAGGLGFGLAAFCGARLARGADVVMAAAGFDAHLAEADLVVTGEGAFDATSLRGKLVGEVLRRAELAGVSAVIVCGRTDGTDAPVRVISLVERAGAERAEAEARRLLDEVGAELAGDVPALAGGVPS